MSVNFLFNLNSPGKIGAVELDAVLSESHSYENSVTSYPVEEGSPITDHVIRKPEEVEINGLVTDSPINPGKVFDKNRASNAFTKFLELAGYDYLDQTSTVAKVKGDFKLVTVVTGLRAYYDMAITSFKVNRGNKTGKSLPFSIRLKKIHFATSRFIQLPNVSETNSKAPNTKNRSVSKVDSGVQATKKPTGSFAEKLFSKLKGKAGKISFGVTESF